MISNFLKVHIPNPVLSVRVSLYDVLLTLEEVRDVLQLRDVVCRVAAVLLQQREHMVVLVAGVGAVQPLQVAADIMVMVSNTRC